MTRRLASGGARLALARFHGASVIDTRRPDPSGECQEGTDEPWIHIYPDNDNERFSIGVYNLPPGIATINMTLIAMEVMGEGTDALSEKVDATYDVGTNGTFTTVFNFHELSPGPYELLVVVSMTSSEVNGTVEGEWPISNDIEVELSTSSATLSFLPVIDDADLPRGSWPRYGQRHR